MLIAIISDTHLPHGKRRLPAECARRMSSSELIMHAGDISRTGSLQELRELGPPVHAVHGNVDEPGLAVELPAELELELEGARLAMTHDAGPATGRLGRMRKRFPHADAVIFGHSHIPLLEQEDGFQIFNPGSPTDRRRQPRHTMGLARIENGSVSFELLTL